MDSDFNSSTVQHFFEEVIPFCKFLQIRLVDLQENSIQILLPFKPEWIGDPRRPALHGGIISTLLDTAGGAIAMSRLVWGQETLSTIDMRVDYLLPGRPEDLIAEASVLRKGNRVVVTRMSAYHPDCVEEIIAEGKAVYNISRRG